MYKRLLCAALVAFAVTAPTSAFALDPDGLLAAVGATGSEPYKCNYVYNSNDDIQSSGICIFGSDVKYGKWFYYGYRGVTGDVTLYVQMCRPDLSSCGTISANSQNWISASNGFVEVNTSSKPNSFGHLYRTCATMHANGFAPWSYVNVCSPFMAG